MKCFFKVFGFWLAALAVSVSSLPAKEKAKTGGLTKDSFTDTAFGYTTSIPSTWKAKTRDEPSLVRLAMEKSDVQINPRYSMERSNAGTRPRFLILADTTSYSAEEFAGRLFGEANWKKKGEYLKALDWRPLDQQLERRTVTVAGQPALQLRFSRDMSVYFGETAVPTPGAEIRAEVVTVFKRGDQVFTTVLFSSQFFLESNFKELLLVYSSWKFVTEEKALDGGATDR